MAVRRITWMTPVAAAMPTPSANDVRRRSSIPAGERLYRVTAAPNKPERALELVRRWTGQAA